MPDTAPSVTLDPPAFHVLAPDAPSPVLLLCDHASNRVPDCIGNGSLGLSRADMDRHIAWDVGAADVTRHLSAALNAPAILSNFSRLVIDPNRGVDDPTLVMKLYDGSIIPENRHIDQAEITRRRRAFYDPYHNAISGQIDAMLARSITPQLISIHSYTPQLRGKPLRPWHVGVLWDKDDRLAKPLIDILGADGQIVVGDNEPYSGQLQGDCMYTHGTSRGLPHVLIEIRNDLIRNSDGQLEWAAKLAPILTQITAAVG